MAGTEQSKMNNLFEVDVINSTVDKFRIYKLFLYAPYEFSLFVINYATVLQLHHHTWELQSLNGQ